MSLVIRRVERASRLVAAAISTLPLSFPGSEVVYQSDEIPTIAFIRQIETVDEFQRRLAVFTNVYGEPIFHRISRMVWNWEERARRQDGGIAVNPRLLERFHPLLDNAGR
jgi:hypothetical protein